MAGKRSDQSSAGKPGPIVTAAAAAARSAREARRADALRRNLGRRKHQARARADEAADGVAGRSSDAAATEEP